MRRRAERGDRMSGILLVHGAWHGPWCWDEFAAHLAGRGHDVRAVRLRGHDQRPGRIWHRVRDYVEDVATAATGFAEAPTVVGHSMGALVVQKYLERHRAAGGVLLAPVPPSGAGGTTLRVARRHPVAFAKANLLLSLRPLIATPALVRELFFTADTPGPIVDACGARLQDESYLAYLDMLALAPARPRRITVPMLVLGAERDMIFTVAEVRRTGRAYRTEAEIFPGMGHDMMLDTGWERVADRIDGWVRERP
jgi:pimeloyl-ACP methyl ester carboxylesterase